MIRARAARGLLLGRSKKTEMGMEGAVFICAHTFTLFLLLHNVMRRRRRDDIMDAAPPHARPKTLSTVRDGRAYATEKNIVGTRDLCC